MPVGEACKCDDRRGQPPGRKEVRSKRRPGKDYGEHGQQKANVAQPDMNLLEVRNPRFADTSALDVLFRGRHWLKM